jgi:hypothetical protein
MSLIRNVSMRVAAMFLPEVEAGACIPRDFCGVCFILTSGRIIGIYNNCAGVCNSQGACPL